MLHLPAHDHGVCLLACNACLHCVLHISHCSLLNDTS